MNSEDFEPTLEDFVRIFNMMRVTPRSKRVTVDPYSGFVEVQAGSIEEAVHIVIRAPEFFARPEAAR